MQFSRLTYLKFKNNDPYKMEMRNRPIFSILLIIYLQLFTGEMNKNYHKLIRYKEEMKTI